MTKSLRGGGQRGGRKREFIRADTASYSCSISSKLTRDATSISWRVLLPSLNPRFIEDLFHMPRRGEDRSLPCSLERLYADAMLRRPTPTASIRMPERQRLPTKYNSPALKDCVR